MLYVSYHSHIMGTVSRYVSYTICHIVSPLIWHIAMQWLRQNISQSLNSQKRHFIAHPYRVWSMGYLLWGFRRRQCYNSIALCYFAHFLSRMRLMSPLQQTWASCCQCGRGAWPRGSTQWVVVCGLWDKLSLPLLLTVISFLVSNDEAYWQQLQEY